MDDLKKLTIDGTDLLLLEMNMSRWTEYTVRELTEMATAGYVKVVLAHIDRFIKFQSPEIWQRLYESDILMQVNASYFNDFFSRRKAVEMLFRGGIHFIGSDCHSVKHRPPTIGNAYDYITKKLGEDFVSRFNEYGYSLLSK